MRIRRDIFTSRKNVDEHAVSVTEGFGTPYSKRQFPRALQVHSTLMVSAFCLNFVRNALFVVRYGFTLQSAFLGVTLVFFKPCVDPRFRTQAL